MKEKQRETKTFIRGNLEYTLIESPDRNGEYPKACFENNPGFALKSIKKLKKK
jgi:hypothetical protein